jgi:hypothetical protein
MVKANSVNTRKKPYLQIFSQNVRGLGKKIDELVINWGKDAPHILCMSEHHLTTEAILSLNIDSYKLGAYYCRKITKSGGVCIYVSKSYQYINLDLDNYCSEQDIEVCAIRLEKNSFNLCILTIYRSSSGNLMSLLKN